MLSSYSGKSEVVVWLFFCVHLFDFIYLLVCEGREVECEWVLLQSQVVGSIGCVARRWCGKKDKL